MNYCVGDTGDCWHWRVFAGTARCPQCAGRLLALPVPELAYPLKGGWGNRQLRDAIVHARCKDVECLACHVLYSTDLYGIPKQIGMLSEARATALRIDRAKATLKARNEEANQNHRRFLLYDGSRVAVRIPLVDLGRRSRHGPPAARIYQTQRTLYRWAHRNHDILFPGG